MSVYLAPTFGAGYQSFTSTTSGASVVNAGGSISTFLAGTTTPASTWSDNSGTVSNGNVITLDSSGRPGTPTNVEIWQTAGQALKYIIKDVNGVQIGIAYDNVLGINDPSGQVTPNTEWVATGLTPSFISSTSFSVPGNQTALFPIGERVKTTNTGGTAFSTVSAVSFSTNTTVTVVNGATPLDSGLSTVATGLFLASAPSVSAIGVAYDASITPPASPVSIASPIQRLDRGDTLATTTGTAPTYILTPTQVLGAYATNSPMLVKFHQSTAVGATPTLNVSGLGALNLVQVNSAGTQVAAQIVAGLITEVVYDGTSLVLLSGYPSGRYLRTTVFTASGTWTKGADVGSIIVQGVGGGGGANGFGTGCGGGGSGGYSRVRNTAPAASYTVTIGAGGSVAGGNGAATTFGSLLTANGGTGNTGTTAGAAGGAAGVGDITLVGGGAGYGGSWSANIYFGPGGNSALGGGAPGMLGSATGTAGATNTGGGASGGTTTGAIGGSGICIVDEYS